MSCPQEMARSGAESAANVRTTPLMYAGTPPTSSTVPAKQPSSHRVRGLPSRTSRKGKARPRAAERGNTDE